MKTQLLVHIACICKHKENISTQQPQNKNLQVTHQFVSVLGPGQVADLGAGVCAL